MKIITLCLATVFAGLAAGSALAAEGKLNFIGKVVNASCKLEGVSDSGVIGVSMGAIPLSRLKNSQSGTGPAVGIDIRVKDCEKGTYYNRFLGKILNNVKKWQIPRFINTDKAPAYGRALALLKREGRCPSDVEHRQIKYRNNVIECDHGKLKRIIGATLGFKSMKTAYATIKGIEVMRALRKGQASAFYYGDPLGEMRLVSRVFEM
ncbi:transposase [Klebsiella pneumoniae]|uniref:DDE-type integrase/transposase/recombinase n=1 Tax=Klebsiella pneumoniae TaxID=573 RepID=UPI000E2C8DCF|nr:DDE-type integrase/transposase/recombinase [Klebsiella pneumoniae]SYR90044.1 transposase [Klebsiella pneumoniae]